MLIYVQNDGQIIGYNTYLTEEQAQPWLAKTPMARWIEETYNPPEVQAGKVLEMWLAAGKIEYRQVDAPAPAAD
ncbi:MAG: hypothetical protein VB085_13450 [Peptococcaceae bacterium]|nr:hypothetical protein [Peptococcaceae bacterium]